MNSATPFSWWRGGKEINLQTWNFLALVSLFSPNDDAMEPDVPATRSWTQFFLFLHQQERLEAIANRCDHMTVTFRGLYTVYLYSTCASINMVGMPWYLLNTSCTRVNGLYLNRSILVLCALHLSVCIHQFTLIYPSEAAASVVNSAGLCLSHTESESARLIMTFSITLNSECYSKVRGFRWIYGVFVMHKSPPG